MILCVGLQRRIISLKTKVLSIANQETFIRRKKKILANFWPSVPAWVLQIWSLNKQIKIYSEILFIFIRSYHYKTKHYVPDMNDQSDGHLILFSVDICNYNHLKCLQSRFLITVLNVPTHSRPDMLIFCSVSRMCKTF